MNRRIARRWAAACLMLASTAVAGDPAPVPQQAPAAITPDLTRPNFLVEVGREFLDTIASTTDSRCEPINRNEKGTRTVGTQLTNTRLNVETVPSAACGRLDLVLTGVTNACTDSQQKRIYLGNAIRIDFCSRKTLLIDENGVREMPAQSDPHVHNQLRYIDPDVLCLVRPVVKRLAHRVYLKQEPKLNQDIANDAAKQVNEEFDKKSQKPLQDFNERYRKEYREPMREKGIFPQRVRFLSSDRQLGIRALLLDPLGKPMNIAPVPEIHGWPDLSVRVDESMLNHITQKLYTDDHGKGRELTGEEFDDELNSLFGALAGEIKTIAPGDQPFTIKFQDERPWVFRFDDQKISVTLRGQEFSYGDPVYDAMDITAVYRLRKTDVGLIAEREGDLRIYPPGFVEGRDRLPARKKIIRDLLDSKLSKAFKPVFEYKEIKLPESMKNGGRLITTQVEADRGWMVMAWRHIAKAPQPPAPTEMKE